MDRCAIPHVGRAICPGPGLLQGPEGPAADQRRACPCLQEVDFLVTTPNLLPASIPNPQAGRNGVSRRARDRASCPDTQSSNATGCSITIPVVHPSRLPSGFSSSVVHSTRRAVAGGDATRVCPERVAGLPGRCRIAAAHNAAAIPAEPSVGPGEQLSVA